MAEVDETNPFLRPRTGTNVVVDIDPFADLLAQDSSTEGLSEDPLAMIDLVVAEERAAGKSINKTDRDILLRCAVEELLFDLEEAEVFGFGEDMFDELADEAEGSDEYDEEDDDGEYSDGEYGFDDDDYSSSDEIDSEYVAIARLCRRETIPEEDENEYIDVRRGDASDYIDVRRAGNAEGDYIDVKRTATAAGDTGYVDVQRSSGDVGYVDVQRSGSEAGYIDVQHGGAVPADPGYIAVQRGDASASELGNPDAGTDAAEPPSFDDQLAMLDLAMNSLQSTVEVSPSSATSRAAPPTPSGTSSPSLTTHDGSPSAASGRVVTHADKAGGAWFLKKAERIGKDQRRYFVLDKDEFKYYTGVDETGPTGFKGSIVLRPTSNITVSGGELFIDNPERRWELIAGSAHDAQEWAQRLKAAAAAASVDAGRDRLDSKPRGFRASLQFFKGSSPANSPGASPAAARPPANPPVNTTAAVVPQQAAAPPPPAAAAPPTQSSAIPNMPTLRPSGRLPTLDAERRASVRRMSFATRVSRARAMFNNNGDSSAAPATSLSTTAPNASQSPLAATSTASVSAPSTTSASAPPTTNSPAAAPAASAVVKAPAPAPAPAPATSSTSTTSSSLTAPSDIQDDRRLSISSRIARARARMGATFPRSAPGSAASTPSSAGAVARTPAPATIRHSPAPAPVTTPAPAPAPTPMAAATAPARAPPPSSSAPPSSSDSFADDRTVSFGTRLRQARAVFGSPSAANKTSAPAAPSATPAPAPAASRTPAPAPAATPTPTRVVAPTPSVQPSKPVAVTTKIVVTNAEPTPYSGGPVTQRSGSIARSPSRRSRRRRLSSAARRKDNNNNDNAASTEGAADQRNRLQSTSRQRIASFRDRKLSQSVATGTLQEQRALAAARWVDKELRKLIAQIKNIGRQSPDGQWSVTFGELFSQSDHLFEALAGTLKTGRTHKVVTFVGEHLFQGMHNDVVITLLKEEIADSTLETYSYRQVRRCSFRNSQRKGKGFSDTSLQLTQSKCHVCAKTVYPVEFVGAADKAFHKNCFRCKDCNCKLTATTYCCTNDMFFCRIHYEQNFKRAGDYTKGFS
eukprot:m.289018 g.289018  ORF g.289018 m.289018 type:complete len:1086 (+) comp12061_c0_seq1:174-3431(+)